MTVHANDAHPFPNLIPTDVAWAAGFIDGEGCIAIARYTLRLQVNQVDPAPLIKLRELFGGAIHQQQVLRNSRKRVLWSWAVGARNALYVLEAIRPYLTTKAIQADLGIEFGRGVRTSKIGQPKVLPVVEVERRLGIKRRMTEEKWKVYA